MTNEKNEENTLPILPHEILEQIFLNADGATLGRCKQLNKEWNYILSHPPRAFISRWKKIAFSEIPEDYRLDIVHSLIPKFFFGISDSLWYDVYKCWFQWKNIGRWQVSVSSVYSSPDVSCLAVSGPWLFIATNNKGLVKALNYKTGTEKNLYQGSEVIQMHPRVTSDPEIEFREPLSHGNLPGVEHDQLVLITHKNFDVVIDLHGFEVHKVVPKRKACYQLSHYEDREVKISSGNFSCQIQSYNINDIDDSKAKKSVLKCHSEVWNVIHVWNKKVLLQSTQGVYKVLNYELENTNHPINGLSVKVNCGTDGIYNWHIGVVLHVNASMFSAHWMRIYVNGKDVVYNPFSTFSAHVYSALYHGGMFFLGLDTGVIVGYRVSAPEELLYLNLREYIWKIDLHDSPITQMIVKETEKLPILWATSDQSVFQIDFKV